MRFVSLVENGTHVLFGTQLGGYGEGEITLAHKTLPSLKKGMLCLADRNFFGFDLWKKAHATGADLLWRVKTNLRLPCEKRLSDGSYLSTIYRSDKDRRRGANGIRVRVIEYTLEGVANAEPMYRLLTSILDPDQAPAEELAALYHERWEIETALDELKTHLRGSKIVLQQQDPGPGAPGILRADDDAFCRPRTHVSVAAKKGASLAVETEPGVGLRAGLRWAQEWGRSDCFPLSGRIVFGFDQWGAVSLAFDLEDDRSFDQAVEESHRQRAIDQILSPFVEVHVCHQRCGALLVA